MKEANKTRGIKNRKAAFLAVIASLVLAACCLPIAQASWRVKAEETADSQAFFLTEDRTTQGFWYNLNLEDDDPNNDDGLLEHVDNRNYGKDGLVLFHHWLRQNGQQESNVSKLNDFADNHTEKYYNGEKVNYVEYPSYVSDIKGNIDAFNGTFRYWMNTPQTFSQTLLEALGGVQPLPIEGVKHDGEEFTWSHGGFSRELGGTTRFDVTVTDDDWHTVSYYLGWAYRHKYMGDYDNIVRIYAPDGKLLAEHTVPLANQGVYARFAVKGSFTVELEGVGYAAYSNGLFFDAVPTATVLGTEGLTATLTPPRTVTLNWTNKTAAGGEAQTDMVTSVYRRIKGGLWDRIAELDSDVTTYTDTDTNVAAEYEYVLASGYRDTFDPVYRYAQIKNGFVQPKICVTDYQAPDFTAAKSVETAPYTLSEARSQDASFAVAQNETFTVRVDLVKTDDGKDVAYENKTWDAFADHEVKFTLEGENVIAGVTYDGAPVYNMERNLGQVTTDGEGYAELECSIPYVGEYEVVVSTEPQAKTDPVTGEQDPMKGYDGATARIRVSVRALPSVNPETPVLFSITDSVRAGDTVNLTGYNVRDDGEFTVAFVKNKGHEPTGISKDDKVYALDRKDIIFTDELNGTGMMFKFPENLEAGTYDFYIKNSKGYSNGVTLNAARPLYLDQEGAYEGQEIQIVGRNFLQNEFGVGDLESAYDALRVKLTQVADANGAPVEGMSYYLSAKNGGILTGLKLRKEDAVAFEGDAIEPEDIPYTNPYRITVKIPAVYDFGTYEVSVANDGKDFRKLSDHCLLTIYEKKAQNWDTDVFGEYGDAHVGNDPLDLGVYWAQDLNYTNIATFDPDDERNTFERAAEFKKHINDTITKLSNAGGGVLYFPAGKYYIFSEIMFRKNVILVGDGADKTELVYADNKNIGKAWWRSVANSNGDVNSNNIGIARVKMTGVDDRLFVSEEKGNAIGGKEGWNVPRYVLKWDGDPMNVKGTPDQDRTVTSVTNRFLVDIESDMFAEEKIAATIDETKGERMISIGGKNLVMRNSHYKGAICSIEINSYGTMWGVAFDYNGAKEMSPHWNGRYCLMENCYFDMHGMGHGPSIKSHVYIAHTYVTGTGNRDNPTNDGEALLMEAPSGTFSTGMVLGASPRTVTLNFRGGQKIAHEPDKGNNGTGTYTRYNMCAVYISSGTGTGQYRYIKTNGHGYGGITYDFMDWEKDWDVLPDHTSVFAVIAPLNNMTVYRYKAYDCVSSICIYSNHIDTVVDGCTLVKTAGITGGGLASGGMAGGRINPMMNVRIINNDISGVGSHYDSGLLAAIVGQSGGIQIYSGGSGDYMGMLTSGIVIKGNNLHDLFPTTAGKDKNESTGITLYFRGGQNDSQNGMRYIIVEDNVIDGSEGGLTVGKYMTGVVVSDNRVENTTDSDADVTVDRPIGFYAPAYHTLYVNGEISDLSGVYQMDELLPAAVSADGKAYLGWTTDATFGANSTVVDRAFGKSVTLYAVFGYKVQFDYNFLREDGSPRGIYSEFVVSDNGTAESGMAGVVDPFRQGYTFLGWYTDKNCSEAFDPAKTVDGNITVYAKWSNTDYSAATESTAAAGTYEIRKSAALPITLSVVIGLLFVAGAGTATFFIMRAKTQKEHKGE